MAATTVVTISRQLGSGGSQIGQIVAARLRFHYADREVLELAAKALGMEERELAERDERLSSLWDSLTPAFVVGWPDAQYLPPPIRVVTDDALFATERRVIRTLASSGDCVIVGRGAVHVLRDDPDAIHVFLHAPVEFRVRRTMEVYEVRTEEDALSRIRESDRSRERFLRRMAGFDWTLATNYHLSLDTSRLSLEQTAQVIVDYVAAARRPGAPPAKT